MGRWIAVAKATDLSQGGRTLLTVEGKSIGLFHLGDEIVAVLNLCPHELAPVCRGHLGGTTLPSRPDQPRQWGRDGEILSCPWHGWEFDLRNGKCLTDRRSLKRYPTRVRDNNIEIEL